MLGCFGVAPPLGQAISTATSGPYGGNMDYRRFGPGATAYFPVFAPGALFFLGDGHFCPGRRRDRRHRHRNLVRGRVHGRGAEGPRGRLAARRDGGAHLHARQRPPARSGAAARDHRDDRLARRRLRPRRAGGQPSARPGRALRRRQRVQPRLFRRLPAARNACSPRWPHERRASRGARAGREPARSRSPPTMCAASARRAPPSSASRRTPA